MLRVFLVKRKYLCSCFLFTAASVQFKQSEFRCCTSNLLVLRAAHNREKVFVMGDTVF